MGDFSLSGGVEVFGFISPTNTNDTYPVIDPLYGIDGFRNVDTISDLDNIPGPRRRAGMVVGVSGGTSYYKLNQSPWNYNITDWSVFNSGSSGATISGNYLPLSGGTVTGQVIFSGSSPNPEYITFFKGANTGAKLGIGVSGNLSDGITNDILNSGGTGNAKLTITSSEVVNNIVDGNGIVIMPNAFNITPTGDIIVGGIAEFTTPPAIENTNDHFLTRNQLTGIIEVRELQTFPVIDSFTFNTSTYDLTIGLNDGGQYGVDLSILAQNTFVTGGTYNGSTITFTNNTGGTFTVTGITSSTSFTGGTVTGATNFTNGLTANTISATTYQNLPTDIRVTGATYSNGSATFTNNTGGTFNVSGFYTGATDVFVTGGTYSNGTTTFTNNTGGTFNVTGYYTGETDDNQYVTGFTYNNNQFTISDNSGNTFNATINTVTGLTVNGAISATTYQNLPLDIRVTGGTYSNGTTTFTNNTGGTFNVTGFYTGGTDVFVTGGTYFGSTITFTNNTGGTFTVTGITSSTTSSSFTGGTVTGSTIFTNGLTANTISATTYQNLPTDIRVTGGTYSNGTTIFTNNTGGTFNVTGFYTGETDDNQYVTGFTYNDSNQFTISDNSGNTFNATINTVTGLTVNGSISATTYQNLPTDVFVTGGTYSAGTTTFTNNTGGTFNVTGLFTGVTNTGRVLYVSNNGNDGTAVIGDISKPWLNLYSAKSASTSGDTIYVLPGTWVLDNRTSNGSPYNGQINTLVNLWKNGITWYFSPNSKIIFYNQTVTGENMNLFNPSGATYETCTVKGYLEFEGYSTGVDTVNGYTNFFKAQEIVGTSGLGYNFICEVKSVITSPSTIDGVRDNVISTTGTVLISADYMAQNYIGGQTGAGTVLSFRGSGLLDMTYNIKQLSHNCYYGLICRNFQTKSRLVCNVDNWDASKTNYAGNQPSIKIQSCASRNKSINVGAMYFKYRVVENLQGSDILNLNGDLYDVDETQNGTLFQYWNSGAATLNYKGNISIYSPGRAVTYTTVVGHKINIVGDIILSNASTAYTATLLYSDNGTTDFSGNIYGNNAGNIVMVRLGNVNINNSYIKSTVSGSRLVDNINATTSTFRLNNSYVELKSDTTPLSKGTYINQFINNSTIINTGTGDTISNSATTGNLQILNSTVTSSYSGSTSINYTGSTTVVSSNTVVNTPYNITNIKGNINVFTDLSY